MSPGPDPITILQRKFYSMFYSFEFSCFANVELATFLLVRSHPNQSNRRSAVQCSDTSTLKVSEYILT